jgi:hypothetical protein
VQIHAACVLLFTYGDDDPAPANDDEVALIYRIEGLDDPQPEPQPAA